MRDYRHIERYLNELAGDVYGQPPDEGHQEALEEIADKWLPHLHGLESILDVGCGQGQAFPVLGRYAQRVVGVTLEPDAGVCQEKGLDTHRADIAFLPFEDESFDLVWARHIIEHSPMPLLALMEWHRVARQWLLLVAPSFDHYGPDGRNHYYVLLPEQWQALMGRAGWHVIWSDESHETEHRWLCEKVERNQKWT